jgi:carbonic anhydrase
MTSLDPLFVSNRAWAAARTASDPMFFARLAEQQAPRFLWIGCSDSRVPANEIVGLQPGELFVHRNVANLVIHTDLNCLSVLQYAVDALQVEHVLVVGHYGCGGILAALQGQPIGLVDNWLRHVQDIADLHRHRLADLAPQDVADRMCELNVIEQAANICRTSILQDAWRRGKSVTVHGAVYALQDGILRDLGFHVAAADELAAAYDLAVAKPGDRRERGTS